MNGGYKVMDQKFISRFARRRAAINKAKKQDAQDTEMIKKLLKAGYECPVAGPWLVELSKYDAPFSEWKQIFEDFLTERYAKRLGEELGRAKAKLTMDKIQASYPQKPVVSLLCKDNPAYKKGEGRKEAAA